MPGLRGASLRPARAAALAVVGALGLLGAASCVRQMSPLRTAPGTAASPGAPWAPPPEALPAPSASPSSSSPAGTAAAMIPPDLLKSAQSWRLTDLIDLALRLSPDTRVAWAQARAAAADLGSRKGQYYPTIAADVNANKSKGSAVGGKFTFLATSYNPFVALNYLLLDFGGRGAAIEEAKQALVAADWTQNATIQDVVLRVEQGYYQYLDALALEQAEQAAVKEAQANLDAADRRRAAGVATIADVLQAKTALSQARLSLETVQGQIQTIHGVLATAIGVPANAAFDVLIPQDEIPDQEATVEVERSIAEAQARRPDLAAARALVLKSDATIRGLKAQDRPFITTSINAGRIYYTPSDIHQDTYSGTLLLTIPLFNGLTYNYNLFKARAEKEEAQARLDSLEQQVVFQVWSSYYSHKTAAQRVATARDLLESARQSQEVVSARYKAGVGSILDLLTAQSALENARAQEVQARADWFLSLAQLAHDTGSLWRPGPGAAGREPTGGTP